MEIKNRKNKIKNKNIKFHTQNIKNNILDEINIKQTPTLKENKQEDKLKNIESIEQYDHTDRSRIKNNEKNEFNFNNNYSTKNDKYKHGIHKKNLLIQTRINEIINNKNNSNSLSDIIKNKKMISSPILDTNLVFLNYIKNKNEEERNETDEKEIKESIENDDYLNNEIENLKKEIASIQENNILLLNKLNEEKNKNISLMNYNKEDEDNIPNDIEINNILIDIANSLQIESFDDIEPKLNEMIKYLNTNIFEKSEENNKKNELIARLKDLFISKHEKNIKKEDISIKVLWRWIKYLINNYKSLLLEKEKNMEIFNSLNEKENFYKDYCLELMNKYHAKNLEELNRFIEELIKKNNINRKRVEQLKKILINDNNTNKDNNNLDLNMGKEFKNRSNEDIKFKNH